MVSFLEGREISWYMVSMVNLFLFLPLLGINGFLGCRMSQEIPTPLQLFMSQGQPRQIWHGPYLLLPISSVGFSLPPSASLFFPLPSAPLKSFPFLCFPIFHSSFQLVSVDFPFLAHLQYNFLKNLVRGQWVWLSSRQPAWESCLFSPETLFLLYLCTFCFG